MEQLPVNTSLTREDIIYEGDHSIVFKTSSPVFGKNIIAKVLRDEHPSEEVMQSFFNEYRISNFLKETKARKALAKGFFANKYAMILEYHSGVTLKNYLSSKKLTLKEQLSIAVQIAQAIHEIHQTGVIHKDINPNNILFDEETNSIQIIDFGISSRLDYKTEQQRNPEKLQGTLLYIAPEQTGRMNRLVDKRSDLYSFGVILYELFTGQLPFIANDQMELVHQHIAQAPLSPTLLSISIPVVISDIILKLMAKNAEDRYQSAAGLVLDLKRALEDLELGNTPNFEIAKYDFTGRLQFPQRLFGRDDALNVLTRQYHLTAEGRTTLCYVAGAPGTGKSALVQELNKRLASDAFLFAEGKFDRLQRNIPFSAVIQAFKKLVEQLLTERPNRILHLKEALTNALSDIGKVVTDVVPNLELILGEQPPVRELGSTEQQNRFYFAITRFIQTICSAHAPIVLFLDDMQWADLASLELFERLTSEVDGSRLMIIMAYRDNEITSTHPFQQFRVKLAKSLGDAPQVNLGNLTKSDVSNFVHETLIKTKNDSLELTELIYNKTQGNAFFTSQFLKLLEEKELLQFNFDALYWDWDINSISKMEITDNVVSLMTDKLKTLPKESLILLQEAACIGTLFYVNQLATIGNKSIYDTIQLLQPVVQAGLVTVKGKSAELFYNDELAENSIIAVSFIHDRVRQAAYSMMNDMEKQHVHLSIGRLLLENLTEHDLEEHIFDVINHFKEGQLLIASEQERYAIGRLNVRAAQKAKKSSAFAAVVSCLLDAIHLLQETIWENHELGQLVFSDLAESYYLIGDFDSSERFVLQLLSHCNTPIERVKAMTIQMEIYKGRTNFLEALQVSLDALKLLGEPLPEKPTKLHMVRALIKVKMMIGRRKATDLEKLPLMKNPEKLLAMKMLARTGLTAYIALPELLPLISLKELYLSLKYGNTEFSAQTYGVYGFINGMMGNAKARAEYQQLSWKIFNQFNAPEMEGKIVMVTNGLIQHWQIPLKDTIDPYIKALQIGKENGDLDVQFTASILHWDHFYFSGASIIKADELAKEYLTHNKKIKQNQGINLFNHYLELLQKLRSDDENAFQFIPEIDENIFIENSDKVGFVKVNCLYAKALLQLGKYKEAMYCIDRAKVHYESCMGLIYNWIFDFLEAVTCYNLAYSEKSNKYIKRAQKAKNKIKKYSAINPATFEYLYSFLVGLEERQKQNSLGSVEHLNKAIQNAQLNGFKQDEAWFNAVLGEYYMDMAQPRIGLMYLAESLHLGYQLGMIAHSKRLSENYPELLMSLKHNSATGTTTIHTTTQYGFGNSMDFSTVTKAATAISSEIVLDRLLKKLIVLAVENAGAELGYLILQRDEEFVVQAGFTVGQEDQIGTKEEPLKDHPSIAEAIVHYVLRTKDSIVLSNASEDQRFKNDYGIKTNNLKSVLCVPINNQGKLIGVVYLENNLTEGAFTPERIEVIQILASQAAVSLDNAFLYQNLERKVEERTLEIRLQKEIIEEKNNDILSSIHYAKRIQDAILPRNEEIKKHLNHFILFQPKDIVSGDFYWFHPYEDQNDEKTILFAAADCTGHGVPGALMSMVGSNVLNQIVNEQKILNPSEILNALNKGISTALQQTGEFTEDQTRDGMDIALCKLTYCEDGIINFSYSGANRPLWIISNNGEVVEFKANKQAIGGGYKIESFTEHYISVSKGDMIYIFSDGYADQFGGDKGKKYMTGQMKSSLQEIKHLPLEEQKSELLNRFTNWRGEHEQIDDVLVFGVRI